MLRTNHSINRYEILQLVGGSAGTETNDEKENAPEGEVTVEKSADGYTEGIPGPVTRLFVLANRGIANLIQDLILVSFNGSQIQ